jgi:S-DNA-T family DNA segregation ATPase FtsK/SpoIIIE
MSSQKKKKETFEPDGEDFVSLYISPHAKRSIAAIVLFVIAVLFLLGFFNAAGVVGRTLDAGVSAAFGNGKYVAPFVCAFAGFILLRTKVETQFYVTKIIGVSLAFWSFLGLLHITASSFSDESMQVMAQMGKGGGYMGYVLGGSLVKFTGMIAGTIIVVALVVVGLIVAFNMSLVGLSDRMPSVAIKRPFFARKAAQDDLDDDPEDDVEDDEDEAHNEDDGETSGEYDDLGDDFDDADPVDPSVPEDTVMPDTGMAKIDRIVEENFTKTFTPANDEDVEWELPPLKLLKRGGDKAQGGDVKQRALRIQETFANFGIAMEPEDIVTGPTVTQYSFRPQSGVKLSRITALNADLALALAAHPIRIEAPIPGKSLVGIEVPNKIPATVRMRDVLNTDAFDDPSTPLLLALGKDVNGDCVFENLAKMPHLLVAGTTGSGKSVTINSILLSLLYKNSPDDLKLILVDPKRVELTLYSGIPHLLADVVVDNGKVVNALKWAIGEMERRYKLLQQTGSRDIASYNHKRAEGEMRTFTDPETGQRCREELERLPFIIIVIDELSDLMSSHGKEVEASIVRIAQMSRAVGIHLIISTQRPSVEVITGLIKANLPTRIALKVNSNIDSRTIIDMPGAEKLVGNGDMLFVGPNNSRPRRLQGVYIEEEEVRKVVNFIKRQAQSSGMYDIDEDFEGADDTQSTPSGGMTQVDFDNTDAHANGSTDPIYEEAKELVIAAGKASTSYIQRRLRIGYSRAARLIDEMEQNGIVGPPEGSKPRTVLVGKDDDEAPTE